MRSHEIVPEPGWCLLEQGVVCMGPATRSGCGAQCTSVLMPCRGCYGCAGDSIDQGAAMIAALGTIVDSEDEQVIHRDASHEVVDPGRHLLLLHAAHLGARPCARGRSDAGRCAVSPRLSIDPITRLEGHGRIDLFLDDAGAVENAYLIIPELRGFEKFLEGRPVEEMPQLTARICGVCPEAHHAAAAKAADAVYGVTIPNAAEVVRRLQYNAFMAGDHATHFFALGGPDFIVGPDAPAAERNIIGVIRTVGPELAGQVIRMRKEGHEVAELLGGRRIHPVDGARRTLAAGVRRDRRTARRDRRYMVDFSQAAIRSSPRSCSRTRASRT